MNKMEFYNVCDCEGSMELFKYCKANDWTSCEDWEDFYKNGCELEFFGGDPDMVKVNGEVSYFYKCGDKVFYYCYCYGEETEAMLKKFFETYETGITIGGQGYARGENPEGVYDVTAEDGKPIWDKWDKMECGFAFRGGGGYAYWVSDWSEWYKQNIEK